MTRRNFSPKTKAAIRERSGGVCEVHRVPRCMYPALPETCTRPGSEVDHITPDYAGGDNSSDNGAYLCDTCHKIKTVTDNKEAKRSNRLAGNSQADKRAKAKAEGRHRKMGSKPWPKGPSALSKDSEHYQRARALKEGKRDDNAGTIRKHTND